MVLFTYRYLFKSKDNPDSVGVKYLTDTEEGLKRLDDCIRSDENIISCLREYIDQVDCSLIGFTEGIKKNEEEK